MASRCRSFSKPAFNLLKSTVSPKSTSRIPSSFLSPSSPSFPRSLSPLGALQSLIPLHSAVASARLTSCLGIDSTSSRSLSQVYKVEVNKSIRIS
ncbi:hypothetical protein V2J09_005283 [Rumex salicifolius]